MQETLKAALLGAFVALIGVSATNRANQKNLRAQLEHDRLSRAKEHALGLRKEIYLNVAETLAEGLRAVIALNDLSKNSIEIIQPYSSKAASMARIHVIAQERTAILFAEFAGKIDQCFIDLRLARQPIEQIYADMRYRERQRNEHGTSRNQMFELFKQERLAGQVSNERIEILKEMFERERELEDRYEAERAELAKKLLPLHHAFTQRCFEERDRAVRTALPLLASVRSELELPIDETLYAQVLKPSEDRKKNLERLFGLHDSTTPSKPNSTDSVESEGGQRSV
ncbi:MAG: hypothetical protein ACT6SF_20480 [Hydrogenophaga sp.]|uniref:hypothetical protein n=1 Tax=Hydrogenophaga sp. TaxID=1904254 RepID=UPI004036F47F